MRNNERGEKGDQERRKMTEGKNNDRGKGREGIVKEGKGEEEENE